MIVEGAANAVGLLVLLAWIPLTVLAFALLRPPIAVTLSILGSAMFVVVGIGIDLPMVPPLGKFGLPGVVCLLCSLLWVPRLVVRVPGFGVPDACLLLLILVSLLTPQFNADTLVYGPTILPPMTSYDSISFVFRNLVFIGIPYWLGRSLFVRREDVAMLLRALLAGGLVYSILIVYEARFSPHLHHWLYGFHQMDFAMAMRWGGYRPMVFMRSGLEVAMFVFTALIAALTLTRARASLLRIPVWPLSLYLAGILVLTKSLGAIIYGVTLAPLAVLLKPRLLATLSAVMAAFILAYPLLWTVDMVPVQEISGFFEGIDAERAGSLRGRLENEEALMEKARERPLLGWGTFGRNRIYEPVSGRDLSVTDGFWVIQLGTTGVLGFLAVFGILLAPVFSAWRRIPAMRSPRDQRLLAGLALILVVLVLDLLPNGFLSSLTLLLAGALHRATRPRVAAAPEQTTEESLPELEALPELGSVPAPQPVKAPPGLRH